MSLVKERYVMVRTVMMAARSILWATGVMGVMVLGVSVCSRAADLRVSLNGEWEACAGHLNDDYTTMISRERTWQPVTVPARKWPTDELNKAAAVWARRTVVFPDHLAGYEGVLHCGRVHWGAKSWVNGVAVGENPVTCPYEVALPAGLLHPGANLVVLRVGGWSSVPKREGVPLIPAGFPSFRGPRPGALFGDVWLDFYRRAYLSEVLMMPDVSHSKVTVRARVDSVNPLNGEATLSARATPWQSGGVAVGKELGAGETRIDLGRSPGPFDLAVPLREAKLWSPESPNLCLAHVELTTGGRLWHARDIRFGQREFRIVDGHFELNGERFFMRGENLMWQWFWSDAWYADAAKIKHYLVDVARGLNSRGWRTHTSPPPDNWLDLADENGMLLLSEFPMILNYGQWPFSDEDWEVYKRNALLEAEGWVRAQCNRPSVIIWVPTNEFHVQQQWQNTTLYRAIKTRDPTRPVMRAGGDTPDMMDTHSYSGMWDGADGDLAGSMLWSVQNRDPRRPLTISEYLGGWGRDQQLRLNGRAGTDYEALLSYGQIIAEQTELLQRLQYDLILPYGCSGRSDEANMTSPNYHALRCSLAPVTVSLDLFDRNFVAGREIGVDVCLINDTPEPQPVAVDYFITVKSPEFLLNRDFALRPLFKHSFTARVPAFSISRRRVQWPVPAIEGQYFMSAVLTAGKREPVISQRIVRALSPNEPSPALKRGLVLVLGGDAELLSWLKRRGLRFSRPGDTTNERPTVVLVWDAARVSARQRPSATQIRQFVRQGGCLVIQVQDKWDWPALADFSLGKARGSRAYWSDGITPPAVLDGAYLRRWNGLAGLVADGFIQGPLARSGRTLLWMERPETPVLIDATQGGGPVLLSKLAFRGRLDPAGPTYDPAAERLLFNLLEPGNTYKREETP